MVGGLELSCYGAAVPMLLTGPRRLAGRIKRAIIREPPDRMGAFKITPDEAVAAGVLSTDVGRLMFGQVGIHKWTQYLPAYEAEFARFRGRPVRMLEIGVAEGGSLRLWRDYLGADAVIFGVDVNAACAELDVPAEVRIGSQGDPEFLRGVVAEMGGVDLVLDDGSHVAGHQRASFETLFPLLATGGMYAVEDLHTAYWPEFDGAYRRGGSFIELVKDLIDDMHSWYHSEGQSERVDASHWIPRIAVYDSVVFIDKTERARPGHVRVGSRY